MSRALLILNSRADMDRAFHWIANAKPGTRVEFSGPQRTLEQNARMWAMLSDIAEQKTLRGKKWKTDEWKAIFLQACGHEVRALPTLSGLAFFPYGNSSRKLSKEEMAQLLEFMQAWGAENGVIFHDPEYTDARTP